MTFEQIRTNIDQKAYEVTNGQSRREFFDDLVNLFELDANDQIVKRMYSKAWENGHSGGYHEVLAHFHGLVEVFKGE